MAIRFRREDLDHLLNLIEMGRADNAKGHSGSVLDARGATTGEPLAESSLDAVGEGIFADNGSGTEQFMLAPNHALWRQNHDFWVDRLREETSGSWTDQQYFEAARIINTAEYQRIVFTGFADALASGLSDGGHGGHHEFHDSDASLAAELAYAGGGSAGTMFTETMSYVDSVTGELRQVSLAGALADPGGVREPSADDDGDELGHQAPNPLLAAAGGTQLVGSALDLAVSTSARTRETERSQFNQVRADLFAQSGLSALLPYAGWEDFQARNHLSDHLIDDLKTAYPEGFAAMDLWVGGLAELPAVGEIGSTFAGVLTEEITRIRDSDQVSYLDLLEGTNLLKEITSQSFSDIVLRNSSGAAAVDGTGEMSLGELIRGTSGDDVLIGTDGDDILIGGDGNDYLDGGPGADIMIGGRDNDTYVFNWGDGIDTWIDTDTTTGSLDIARFGAGINYDQLWLKRSGNNLEASVIGTTDKAVIQNWYSGSANHIECFEAGGKALLDSKVDLLVQAMAAFAPPGVGQTSLPANYQTALAPVLAANWR